MNILHQETKNAIRSELEWTRATFHMLLDSLSENDLRKKSRNPAWTNGEILAHMTFGFIILNALLPMARLMGPLPKMGIQNIRRIIECIHSTIQLD